ncbi:hypothetical protein DL96DRAFT_1821159 [Flagelloscypha sp. PMI_526]|nr:hypothetical protein DL96DRAFT_1821159 [Flagelloscypha sp. PMI_526]
MPNPRSFSSSASCTDLESERSPSLPQCCGVLQDWRQCTNGAKKGRVCINHVGQDSWLIAAHVSPADRVARANERRCPGLAENNSRLCKNRKAPFTFCHHHVDQGPPAWTLPSSLPHSNNHLHIELRDQFLVLVCAKVGQPRPPSAPSSGRARREPETRQRRDESEAEEWRTADNEEHTETESQRWYPEEQKPQRQPQQSRAGRRQYRQRQQEQRCSSQSGRRSFMHVDDSVSIETAYERCAERLRTFEASLARLDTRRVYTFADIPWPTQDLKPTADSVTSEKVEQFYVALSKHFSEQRMKVELESAQNFFLPDRFKKSGMYAQLQWGANELRDVKYKAGKVAQTLDTLVAKVNNGEQF